MALMGGACIGLAATLLLWATGRVAGISGIVGGLWNVAFNDVGWRLAFIGGLVGVGVLAAWWQPSLVGSATGSRAQLIAAGLLVGFGTRLGGGCTSGHGVCGISRRSPRSIVATCTFIAAGMITVAAMRASGVLS
jgi:uncharacterized protein